jgi:fido (protein-threonine AMPylation protein)
VFSSRTFPLKWFTEERLRKIHYEMFREVWDWAGIYYQGPLRNIGIKSTYIPFQVRELCKDVRFWLESQTEMTFLEQCAQIHFRLAKIHPFPNGNGRHARLCGDLFLHSLFGQKPMWPEIIFVSNGNGRKEYIQTLKNADQGDFSGLIHLIQRYGGQNPAVAKVLKEPFFKQYFSVQKLSETIRNLIKFGCKIDELSHDGHHPLQLAIKKNLSEIAKLLIEKGSNVRQKDKSGMTPLDCAMQTDNRELIALLGKI